ncbi:NAD(P)/FAD-dependent oxidoreductase, partial [Streptomyces lunaelactis]|nr:NAD(P)/FAD-dependent oxidoreductase [Streptomyces lunaelactis]
MATQIVVIGGGTAGTRLARRLAASDAAPGTGTGVTVTVTVIGEEPHTPYNRVL